MTKVIYWEVSDCLLLVLCGLTLGFDGFRLKATYRQAIVVPWREQSPPAVQGC